jgi:hypothetical protein
MFLRRECVYARDDPNYCPLRARFSASSRASAAGTLTSGSTPVLSQFVLVIGFTNRPNDKRMKKRSSIWCGATVWAPWSHRSGSLS